MRVACLILLALSVTVVAPSTAWGRACHVRSGERALAGNKQVRVLKNRQTGGVVGCLRQTGRRSTLVEPESIDHEWGRLRRLVGSILVYRTDYDSGAPGESGSSEIAVDLRTRRQSLIGFTTFNLVWIAERIVLTSRGRMAILRRSASYAPQEEHREVLFCRVGETCGEKARVEKGTQIVANSLRRQQLKACWDVLEHGSTVTRCANLVR
jgi:hypothetical protein